MAIPAASYQPVSYQPNAQRYQHNPPNAQRHQQPNAQRPSRLDNFICEESSRVGTNYIAAIVFGALASLAVLGSITAGICWAAVPLTASMGLTLTISLLASMILFGGACCYAFANAVASAVCVVGAGIGKALGF